ncbi:MAG: hypothetical protein JW769_04320 [Parachlamydiales bacterium]|nr:hypothetical protein [Parachlamydiales bacterium]
MFHALKIILDIQVLDMKMMRLLMLRKERQKELDQIASLKKDLQAQLIEKGQRINELSKEIIINENNITEIKDRLKKLEIKQSSVKKVEEFNALTQEMTKAERERVAKEQATSDMIDKKNREEEILEKIKESLKTTEESSKNLEKEILASIKEINAEGRVLKEKRDALALQADPEVLKIYMRLLQNKRDQVVVPIENRTCSGCHIALTAQHENLVRKGERLIFCEHCSRILYWQESEDLAGTQATTKRRRRKISGV